MRVNRVMEGLLAGTALVLLLGAVFWYARTLGIVGSDPPETSVNPSGPVVTGTEKERKEQRQRAIKAKDPALLPLCTKEDFTNRAKPVPAKSMEPWDHPDQLGCRFPPPQPDQIIVGPRKVPAPRGVREPPITRP